MSRVKLSGAQRAMMARLAEHEDYGVLTGRLAYEVFGTGALAFRATNRMRTLAKRGFVRRHEANDERWFITPAGRAALQEAGHER